MKRLQEQEMLQDTNSDGLTAKEFPDLTFIAKPNLKTLGPRLKGDMGIVQKFFAQAKADGTGNSIKDSLDSTGKYIVRGEDRELKSLQKSCQKLWLVKPLEESRT